MYYVNYKKPGSYVFEVSELKSAIEIAWLLAAFPEEGDIVLVKENEDETVETLLIVEPGNKVSGDKKAVNDYNSLADNKKYDSKVLEEMSKRIHAFATNNKIDK